MSSGLVDSLADFAIGAVVDDLPQAVIEESKRVLLDSIGCSLAGTGNPKGNAGIDCSRVIGGGGHDASIFGTPYRSSVFGAAFANGETINASTSMPCCHLGMSPPTCCQVHWRSPSPLMHRADGLEFSRWLQLILLFGG